jgi:CBS domain-containing protein
MKAGDVMVSNVISVGPDTEIKDVADVLIRNRISGVPVLGSDGELLGIISEGDLIRRPETGTERRPSRWLSLFASPEGEALEFIKSHSTKAADVMTAPVVSASPDTPIATIAALLEKNKIKRVPIVENGKVVGMVSRANLVQALASAAAVAPSSADDTKIRARVMSRLGAENWTRPALMNVIVTNGTVELWGIVDSQTERKAVRVLVETTPGVRGVNDNLIVPRTMAGWY